jgi:glycosyltransferase involved in cell wall biosynthesis
VTLVVINDIVNPTLLESIHPDVEVIRLGRKVGSHNPLPLLKLNALLLRLNPVAIHCHSYTIAGYLLPLLRKKTILTMHTTFVGSMTRSALLKYRELYSISRSVQSVLSEKFSVNSKVIYNGIDFSRFEERRAPRHKGIRIVQVGRLIPEKGHNLSLLALRELLDYSWQFDIIGSGEHEQHLKQLTESLGISDRVHFLGGKSQEYLHENLKNYDILLQPSLVEGFGLTVIEAMAAGVAVIASDVDGLEEVTAGGELATLFKSGDYLSLMEAIKGMLLQPIDELKLQEIRSAAAEKFHIKNTVKQYQKEYGL